MDNPQYAQTQIDKQLAKRPLGLSVLWGGDDTTPYFIEDLDDTFNVVREDGHRQYTTVAWASGYHDVADRLVEIIKAAIDAGELSLPEQED